MATNWELMAQQLYRALITSSGCRCRRGHWDKEKSEYPTVEQCSRCKAILNYELLKAVKEK